MGYKRLKGQNNMRKPSASAQVAATPKCVTSTMCVHWRLLTGEIYADFTFWRNAWLMRSSCSTNRVGKAQRPWKMQRPWTSAWSFPSRIALRIKHHLSQLTKKHCQELMKKHCTWQWHALRRIRPRRTSLTLRPRFIPCSNFNWHIPGKVSREIKDSSTWNPVLRMECAIPIRFLASAECPDLKQKKDNWHCNNWQLTNNQCVQATRGKLSPNAIDEWQWLPLPLLPSAGQHWPWAWPTAALHLHP